jgi:hypothetical protein
MLKLAKIATDRWGISEGASIDVDIIIPPQHLPLAEPFSMDHASHMDLQCGCRIRI